MHASEGETPDICVLAIECRRGSMGRIVDNIQVTGHVPVIRGLRQCFFRTTKLQPCWLQLALFSIIRFLINILIASAMLPES